MPFDDFFRRLNDARGIISQPSQLTEEQLLNDPDPKSLLSGEGLLQGLGGVQALIPDKQVDLGNGMNFDPSGAFGGIKKIPKIFKVGGMEYEANNLAHAMEVQKALEKTGNIPTNSILNPTGEMRGFGRMIDPKESLAQRPVDKTDYSSILEKLKNHFLAVEDLKVANPNFDKPKALLERARMSKPPIK